MIYCVEDESTIRDLMVYTLKASGLDARGFESASDFWPAMIFISDSPQRSSSASQTGSSLCCNTYPRGQHPAR